MAEKTQNVVVGTDRLRRCWWCGADPTYVAYHDDEWGMPVDQDQRLFEKLCLEGFQAGLSWITILRKRPAFREVFDEFDFHRVANFTDARVERLLTDGRIVRHRGKIESTINNAQRAIELIDEFGTLAHYLWRFEPKKSPVIRSREKIRATTDQSAALSKDLKRRGWRFVGPTTCYAFMQSMGMVNDHLRTCHVWESIDQARKTFVRPT